MKTTSSFRLNKQAKRFLALIVDAHERGAYRRALIDAQVSSQSQQRSKAKEK
jgi:hypothetical protein